MNKKIFDKFRDLKGGFYVQKLIVDFGKYVNIKKMGEGLGEVDFNRMTQTVPDDRTIYDSY